MLFLATALFATFLLLLAGLAFAGFKAATRKGDGKNGGGCVPGCLLGCGLFGLALIGLAGFLVMLAAISTDRSIARVALMRRGDLPPEHQLSYALNLRFEVRGDLAAWMESDLRSLLVKLCDCEPDITTQRVLDDEGREVLRVDVALPGEHDVRDFMRWVEDALPSLNGVEGVEVVFRGLGA